MHIKYIYKIIIKVAYFNIEWNIINFIASILFIYIINIENEIS